MTIAFADTNTADRLAAPAEADLLALAEDLIRRACQILRVPTA